MLDIQNVAAPTAPFLNGAGSVVGRSETGEFNFGRYLLGLQTASLNGEFSGNQKTPEAPQKFLDKDEILMNLFQFGQGMGNIAQSLMMGEQKTPDAGDSVFLAENLMVNSVNKENLADVGNVEFVSGKTGIRFSEADLQNTPPLEGVISDALAGREIEGVERFNSISEEMFLDGQKLRKEDMLAETPGVSFADENLKAEGMARSMENLQAIKRYSAFQKDQDRVDSGGNSFEGRDHSVERIRAEADSMADMGLETVGDGAMDKWAENSMNGAGKRGKFDSLTAEFNPFVTRSESGEVSSVDSLSAAKVDSAQGTSVQHLVSKVESMVHNGGGKMTISLQPPELGHVEIEVSTKGNQVEIRMKPENEMAKSILTERIGDLRAAMSAHDLILSRMEIHVVREQPHSFAATHGSFSDGSHANPYFRGNANQGQADHFLDNKNPNPVSTVGVIPVSGMNSTQYGAGRVNLVV